MVASGFMTKLDEKNRCCSWKPLLLFKGSPLTSAPGAPFYHCLECLRVFDPETREQRENWAWRRARSGEFVPTKHAKNTTEHREKP